MSDHTTSPRYSSTRQLYHEACRDLGLKQWGNAADKLASVLEVLEGQAQPDVDEPIANGKGKSADSSPNQPLYGLDAPELAPILHQYGRALLQLAISSSGALGGAPPPTATAAASSSEEPSTNGARFHFGGDAEEEEQEEGQSDADNDAEEQEDEQDDFALAFTVLDLARVRYEKLLDSVSPKPSDTVILTTFDGKKMDLLDTWLEVSEVLSDLGDLGLETENFTQAAADYEASLEIVENPQKLALPGYHRRTADGRLRTALALEYHPDQSTRSKAIELIKGAINALKRRKAAVEEFRKQLENDSGDKSEKRVETEPKKKEAENEPENEAKKDPENKIGAPTETNTRYDDITSISSISKIDAELQDVTELISDLELKLSETTAETSATPGFPSGTKEALERTIVEAFLGASTNSVQGGSSSRAGPFNSAASAQPVNDLSSRVKRRKTDTKSVESGTSNTSSTTPDAIRNTDSDIAAATGEKRGAEEQLAP